MRLQRIMIAGLIFGLTMALGGCASKTDPAASSGSTSESTTTSQSTSQSTSKTEVKAVSVPAGSSLSKVEIGMTDAEVRALLGEPASIRSYPTGKNWIPFYFGGDTYRFDWVYSKTGLVIFANINRFSRSVEVVEVIHNREQS